MQKTNASMPLAKVVSRARKVKKPPNSEATEVTLDSQDEGINSAATPSNFRFRLFAFSLSKSAFSTYTTRSFKHKRKGIHSRMCGRTERR